jgi:predicted secreted protein
MAQEYQVGNKFFLRITVDEEQKFIICEQNSEFSVESEPITVLCKTTGNWTTIIGGGLKSGSASYTGAYLKDPEEDNLSAFQAINLVGGVQEFYWGGLEPGDDSIIFDAHVSSVSITSNTNEAITFTMNLTLADEPEITKVGT